MTFATKQFKYKVDTSVTQPNPLTQLPLQQSLEYQSIRVKWCRVIPSRNKKRPLILLPANSNNPRPRNKPSLHVNSIESSLCNIVDLPLIILHFVLTLLLLYWSRCATLATLGLYSNFLMASFFLLEYKCYNSNVRVIPVSRVQYATVPSASTIHPLYLPINRSTYPAAATRRSITKQALSLST